MSFQLLTNIIPKCLKPKKLHWKSDRCWTASAGGDAKVFYMFTLFYIFDSSHIGAIGKSS